MKKIQPTLPATLFACFVTMAVGNAHADVKEAEAKVKSLEEAKEALKSRHESKLKAIKVMGGAEKDIEKENAKYKKKFAVMIRDISEAKFTLEQEKKKEAPKHKPLEWLTDAEGKVIERTGRKFPENVDKLPSMGNIHKSVGAIYIENAIAAFKEEMKAKGASDNEIQSALEGLKLYPAKWRKNKDTGKWFGWVSHDEIKKDVANAKETLDEALAKFKPADEVSKSVEMVQPVADVASAPNNAALEAKLADITKKYEALKKLICETPTVPQDLK